MHIVWDWNGTLFDDLHIVLEAVNRGLRPFGVGPITLDDYRDHYTRPVKVFYTRLFGREVSDDEWHLLDRRFHEGYRGLLDRASLTVDARLALEQATSLGATQSLLSMFPHAELIPLVGALGIEGYFDRVDGLRGTPGGAKAGYLAEHLRRLIVAEDPSSVLVVGDTPDDADAAAHIGARCVLYDGGAHHGHELETLGVPVARSLVEAVSHLTRTQG